MTFTAYSFEAVHTVLGDGETFSSSGYAEVMGVVIGSSILQMDEPEHHAYRSLLQQAFTKRAMQRWETELVGPLVDRMIDGFVARRPRRPRAPAAVPVPASRSSPRCSGLPDEDLPQFHRLAVELIGVTVDFDRAMPGIAPRSRTTSAAILDERRAHPADDMISVLASAEHDGQRLTDEEIFAFCRLLLPAGAETTYRSSSNLLFGLLTDPDAARRGARHRSLLPQAIEEGIRWEPPLLIISRTATRDSEVVRRHDPRAGATVICNMGSANHDEPRWADPERFDILRPRTAPHRRSPTGRTCASACTSPAWRPRSC